MIWQEQQTADQFIVPDDVQDVFFDIQCRDLPVDHMADLSNALVAAAPWLVDSPNAGIHEVHVAGSQNGWEKPDAALGQKLLLSKRTKLVIRIGKNEIEPLMAALVGKTIDIVGHPMLITSGKPKLLAVSETLNARHIALRPDEVSDEQRFLKRIATQLIELGIYPKKALCGKRAELRTADGPLVTQSLMLADLSPEESIKLQAATIDQYRLLGCGLFLPMKGIKKVIGVD